MTTTQPQVLLGHDVSRAAREYITQHAAPSKWVPGCYESESLCRAQSRVRFDLKIEEAELVRSSYGWSVRSASGLDNFARLASSRMGEVDGSYESALAWARQWQAQSPTTRYVTTREAVAV